MIATEAQIKKTTFNLLKNIAPDTSPEALGEDENLRETLGIDSYDFLNLMIGLNGAFDVEIPETDYGKLISLADIVHYVSTHIK